MSFKTIFVLLFQIHILIQITKTNSLDNNIVFSSLEKHINYDSGDEDGSESGNASNSIRHIYSVVVFEYPVDLHYHKSQVINISRQICSYFTTNENNRNTELSESCSSKIVKHLEALHGQGIFVLLNY